MTLEQKTVSQLYYELQDLMRAGMGDKKVVLSDDEEGNGYHGMYFSVTSHPTGVKELISGRLHDSTEEDSDNIIVVG